MKQKLRNEFYSYLYENYNFTPQTTKSLYQWIDDQNKLRNSLIEKVDLIMDHLGLEIKKIPAQTILKKKDPKG